MSIFKQGYGQSQSCLGSAHVEDSISIMYTFDKGKIFVCLFERLPVFHLPSLPVIIETNLYVYSLQSSVLFFAVKCCLNNVVHESY